jgi:alpha-beta hydrolase superfamily lysophospholipase
LAGGLTLYVMQARRMPDLQPWHEYRLEPDFRATDVDETFESYLAREQRVFRSLDAHVQANRSETRTYNRFVSESPVDPAQFTPNWNRTFVLDPGRPRGAALLLHGLSDSPYSLRAVGEHLHARGFYVVGLRIPGHGTAPAALVRAHWRDWREAVRVAAHHVAARAGDGPFAIVGYSNGAALATDYALRALERDEDPAPTRLILFSGALAVSKAAAFARFQRELARLPGLEKLGWTAILPEYDPYKYNSFPIEAGEQIFDLTAHLHRRLAQGAESGTLAAFPPVLAFQSAVDATIPAASVMDVLLDRLPAIGSQLVVFDVNHRAAADDMLRPAVEALRDRLVDSPPSPYAISVVTNENVTTATVVERNRAAGSEVWSDAATGLSWPTGVYSLSHVALPFPPDDPLYGAVFEPDNPLPPLGTLELRGERSVLVISAAMLMRLRYNPFFAHVLARIDAFLADAGPVGAQATRGD